MTNVNEILENRGSKYGSFENNAYTTQFMKKLFKTHSSWETMSNSQKEALEMIAHKIARILNGDPNYDDSWNDIAGYATLVVKQLKEEENNRVAISK